MISVIIPTYNEEDVIERCIKSILNNPYKNFEIIVVDGGTDKTYEIAKKYKKVKAYKYTKKKGPGSARNYGVKKAKGDIIFFIDADEWIEKDALEKTIEIFKRYKPDAIGYQRVIYKPKDWHRIWEYKYPYNYGKLKRTYFDKNTTICPYIFKKSVFEKTGGFPEGVRYFEDLIYLEKLKKLGIKILITNEIKAHTDMGASFKDFLKRIKLSSMGLLNSKLYKKIIKNFGLFGGLLVSYMTPLFFIYYPLCASYYYKKTKDKLTAFASPFLLFLDKSLTSIFLIYYFLKKRY